MTAVAFGYPSAVIVPPDEKCWPLLPCALIFARTCRARSSHCTRITGCSDGYKSFAIVIECWLRGTCFSVTFEYLPGAQHAHADGLSRQCGQCLQPDCPVSSADAVVGDTGSTIEILDQPFAASEMRDSMDSDLLPELSGETWVAATQLNSATNETVTDVVMPAGFKPAGSIQISRTVTHDLPPAGFIPNSRTATDDLLPAGFKPAGCKPHSVTVADDSLPASFQTNLLVIPVTSDIQPAGFEQNMTTAPRLEVILTG